MRKNKYALPIFKFLYFMYFFTRLHIFVFTKFVLSFICSAKNKMVVIGKKRNIKSRNRLPQKKRRQWTVREKLMVVNFFENNNRNVQINFEKSLNIVR